MSSSLESILTGTVTVSADDAGGSRLLCSIIKHIDKTFLFSLTNTSLPIFSHVFPNIQSFGLSDCLLTSHVLLCSTSWSSTHELKAITQFNDAGKTTIVVLDHWVNYAERLTYMASFVNPSFLVVCDELAHSLALKQFPNSKILLHSNPIFKYFSSLRLDSSAFSNPTRISTSSGQVLNTLLFISQPIKNLSSKLGLTSDHPSFDEVQCLHYGLRNIKLINSDITHVIIRLHPLDVQTTYSQTFQEFSNFTFELSSGHTLEQDLRRSSLVFGIDSTALVLAALAGRPTYSSIPPGGRNCSLPHHFIRKLSDHISY